MDQFSHALQIAAAAHEDQTREDGITPYVMHSLRVMMAVRNPKAKIVALLHDVIEDTFMTMQILADGDLGFDDDVLDAVELLTRKIGEPYEDYIKRVKDNPLAREVKQADLFDNLNSNESDTAKMKRRRKKYENALKILMS